MGDMETVKRLLIRIYGEASGRSAFERIAPRVARAGKRGARSRHVFSQADVVLITYGDSLIQAGERPLATLQGFARRFLKDAVSTIHFLPFFPYSSDDGFSVMDFYQIDPNLGTWDDVAALGRDFGLMFDYVVNHFSAKGQWFADYLNEREGFDAFAIETDPSEDLSDVTRPRSLPLLTEYRKPSGRSVHLWTTFSADQIDFNFKSLDVLEKMIDVMLFYVEKGATVLRMDAIAYLWKEIGTSCIHLPQTHDMVKLFRAVLDIVAPEVIIITETNVPHEENVSYFGNGRDEAQMVYNFTLPPLLYHAFLKGNVSVLSEWAAGLRPASRETTFFNFTASHDGIGVRPLEGILPTAEIDALVAAAERCGGRISHKRNPDGSDSPYELNITYVDAIIGDDRSTRAQPFLASQAIQYALPGVPATYIHSLLGSRNWQAGVVQTGRARTINRETLQVEAVVAALGDPDSFRANVFFPYLKLIQTRRHQPAFHPGAAFDILRPDPGVFAIRRQSGSQTIVALTNVSGKPVHLRLSDGGLGGAAVDLITGERYDPESIDLEAYQYVWLEGAAA